MAPLHLGRMQGVRRSSLVQTISLVPILLEFFGAAILERTQSEPLYNYTVIYTVKTIQAAVTAHEN
ncbi:hypothetical protein GCM10020370_63890 [Paenibacillus hodogayensis]